jgi:hypothetical protein
MDHSEATEMNAVERYVLGDLSVPEVEEFERHFFDCPQCSEELRAVSILQDNARAVFLEPSPAPIPASLPVAESGAGWWKMWWVPALAMLVVGIFAGYETGAHREGSAVQPVSAFPLYAAARGDETAIFPPAGAQFYTLYMDRTWDADFASYRAVIRDEAGEKYSMMLNAPAPGRAIHVLVPRGALTGGKYTLVISGVDGAGTSTEVARYPFTLRVT